MPPPVAPQFPAVASSWNSPSVVSTTVSADSAAASSGRRRPETVRTGRAEGRPW